MKIRVMSHTLRPGITTSTSCPSSNDQKEASDSETEIERFLSTIDNKIFKEDDWNVAFVECRSLAAKWEELSACLGLAKADIDSIKENHPKNSAGCWGEALSYWIKQNYSTERFGLPSWRSLLKAVAVVDKRLTKELASKYPSGLTKLPECVTPTKALGMVSDQPGQVTETVSRLHSVCVVDQSPKSIEKSTHSYSETSLAMIHSNDDKIKALFSALLLKVQKALQSHSVDTDDVRQFLVTFFKQEFTDAKDLGKIFTAATVKGHWDHNNYSPLEKLADHFLPDNPSVEDLIRDYKAQLSGFHMTVKIVDFMEYQKLTADDSDNDSDQAVQLQKLTKKQYRRIKVVLKLNRKVSDLSLLYVDKLWQSIADEYELPSLTAVLEKIVTGSIEISWLVPAYVAEMITQRTKFFRKHHIVLVFIDDIILYDERQMAKLEQLFLELCQRAGTSSADIGLFWKVLMRGVDPDIYDKRGLHPLWYATLHNRADLVQLLLQHHASIDMVTQEGIGETALVAAVNNGHTHIVDILLKNGANANYQTKKGKSPLWKASSLGNTDIVQLLLRHNATFDMPTDDERGDTALFAACGEGHYDTAALLIQHGADIKYQNKTGSTPLVYASYGGNTRLVELLLAHGADVNKGVQSPLYVASLRGNMEVVQLLLHHHADIDQPSEDEFVATPLITACGKNKTEVARFLIERKANINYQNKNGNSPLQVACDRGNTDIVKLLVQSNANIDLKNKEGRTALMVACWRGHLPIVMELIRAGAKIDTQDQEGLTSLMLAAQKGRAEVIKTLLDASANPNITENTAGWCALHFSSKSGNIHITKQLLNNGADAELRDNNGLTALEICKHDDVCDELKRHTITQSQTNTQMTQPTEKWKNEDLVKKSYQKLLRIFDLLEDSLLPGRKEKRLHQQREGTSSNTVEAN